LFYFLYSFLVKLTQKFEWIVWDTWNVLNLTQSFYYINLKMTVRFSMLLDANIFLYFNNFFLFISFISFIFFYFFNFFLIFFLFFFFFFFHFFFFLRFNYLFSYLFELYILWIVHISISQLQIGHYSHACFITAPYVVVDGRVWSVRRAPSGM